MLVGTSSRSLRGETATGGSIASGRRRKPPLNESVCTPGAVSLNRWPPTRSSTTDDTSGGSTAWPSGPLSGQA